MMPPSSSISSHPPVTAKLLLSGLYSASGVQVASTICLASSSSNKSPSNPQTKTAPFVPDTPKKIAKTAEIVDSPWLKEQIPESTPAERYRFVEAREGDLKGALTNMKQLKEWRKKYGPYILEQEEQFPVVEGMSLEELDIREWKICSRAAMKACDQPNYGVRDIPRLPRTAWKDTEARDLKGFRILHFLPAQIDDSICNMHTYAVAIAAYLDRGVSRESTEKVSIHLDLRGGKGWANPPALTLIPFIKEMIKETLTLFPERLQTCILYPLPRSLTWIFSLVKKVIDPVTANKIHLLSGPPKIESPLPMSQMKRHVDERVAIMLEESRMASFIVE